MHFGTPYWSLLDLYRPEKKFRQLELEFEPLAQDDKDLVVEQSGASALTPKVTRRKTFKKLAMENKKVTSWFRKKDQQEDPNCQGRMRRL